jgi:hypothetical protein
MQHLTKLLSHLTPHTPANCSLTFLKPTYVSQRSLLLLLLTPLLSLLLLLFPTPHLHPQQAAA